MGKKINYDNFNEVILKELYSYDPISDEYYMKKKYVVNPSNIINKIEQWIQQMKTNDLRRS